MRWTGIGAAAVVAAMIQGCGSTGTAGAGAAASETPLTPSSVMAFAWIRDGATARPFYEGVLGLRVIADEPAALVLDSGGVVIRLQKAPDRVPESFTVLGWTVPDIRGAAARLRARGVRFERYELMPMQDDSGIATFSNGDQVAWFRDPDGKLLSIAQLH